MKINSNITVREVKNYDELKEFVKPFGLPFYFHPDLAKFSRN